jgi:hypothetical protein
MTASDLNSSASELTPPSSDSPNTSNSQGLPTSSTSDFVGHDTQTSVTQETSPTSTSSSCFSTICTTTTTTSTPSTAVVVIDFEGGVTLPSSASSLDVEGHDSSQSLEEIVIGTTIEVISVDQTPDSGTFTSSPTVYEPIDFSLDSSDTLTSNSTIISTSTDTVSTSFYNWFNPSLSASTSSYTLTETITVSPSPYSSSSSSFSSSITTWTDSSVTVSYSDNTDSTSYVPEPMIGMVSNTIGTPTPSWYTQMTEETSYMTPYSEYTETETVTITY